MDCIIQYDPRAPKISAGKIFHHKSRNGCIICKKRKLKCDESYPCSRCVLGSLQCIFVNDIDALAQNGQWQRAGPISTYAALFASISSSLETLSIPSGRTAIRATISSSSETMLIHAQLAFTAAHLGYTSICRHHINLAIAIYSKMESSPDILLASGAVLSALFYFLDDTWMLFWPGILSGFGTLLRSFWSKNWNDFAEQTSFITSKISYDDGKYAGLLEAIDRLLMKKEFNSEDFVTIMFLPSQFDHDFFEDFRSGVPKVMLLVSLWFVLLKRLNRWWCQGQAVVQGKILLERLDFSSISTHYTTLLTDTFGSSVSS